MFPFLLYFPLSKWQRKLPSEPFTVYFSPLEACAFRRKPVRLAVVELRPEKWQLQAPLLDHLGTDRKAVISPEDVRLREIRLVDPAELGKQK